MILFCLIFFFLNDLFFEHFEFFIDVSGMVHFFGLEIPFEESSFKPISKLNLLVLNHGALVDSTLEVLVSLDSAVMLSSANILPLDSNPDLSVVLSPFVLELTNISNDAGTVVEEDSPGDEGLEINGVGIKLLEAFCFGLKVVVLLLRRFWLLGFEGQSAGNVFGMCGGVFEGLGLGGGQGLWVDG